jgi:hypothetical protein
MRPGPELASLIALTKSLSLARSGRWSGKIKELFSERSVYFQIISQRWN